MYQQTIPFEIHMLYIHMKSINNTQADLNLQLEIIYFS